MHKENTIKYYKWPAITSIIFLFLSFLSWPYGFYTFMKFVVTGSAIYYAYYLYQMKRQNFWFWSLIGIAILFNPIIPVYLRDKTLWGFIDVIIIIFLISLLLRFKKRI